MDSGKSGDSRLDHVAYEYVMMLSAAEQMGIEHPPPVNHLIQTAFLTHLRVLALFFERSTEKNEKEKRKDVGDDICAFQIVDKSPLSTIGWDGGPFVKGGSLRIAINKTVSHLTQKRILSEDSVDSIAPFSGPKHLHGAVSLIRKTWNTFNQCLTPQVRCELSEKVHRAATNMNLDLLTFDARFEDTTDCRRWARDCPPGQSSDS